MPNWRPGLSENSPAGLKHFAVGVLGQTGAVFDHKNPTEV